MERLTGLNRFKGQQERQKGWSWVGVGAQEKTTSKDTRGTLLLSLDDKRSPTDRAPVCPSQWHLQGLERCLMNVPNEWTHGWSALGRESSAPGVFTGQKTELISKDAEESHLSALPVNLK